MNHVEEIQNLRKWHVWEICGIFIIINMLCVYVTKLIITAINVICYFLLENILIRYVGDTSFQNGNKNKMKLWKCISKRTTNKSWYSFIILIKYFTIYNEVGILYLIINTMSHWILVLHTKLCFYSYNLTEM